LAIAGKEKGLAPKDLPAATRALPGAAQNMRGTVICETDVVLPGRNLLFLPVLFCTGIFD